MQMNSDVQRQGRQAKARKRSSVLYVVTAGIVLLFIGVASWSAMNYSPSSTSASLGSSKSAQANSPSSLGYLQGATAPDFTYTLLDGTEMSLSSLRGKPVVLNFWASWCPPCRAEARTLEKVWEAYKGKGVQFLGVAVNDQEKDAKAFLKEFGITYPNGQDTTTKISASYAITGIPETFFITKDGKIARHWIGPIEEKQLSSFIEGILQ